MNDTLKMFLIALITAVIVQLILGPEIMKMRGIIPQQPQPAPAVANQGVGGVTPQTTPVQPPPTVAPPVVDAPKPTIAPNYLTLQVNKARELAHSQGIVVIEDGQKPVEGTPPGQIIEQVPAAGSTMANAEIRVIVAASAGSKKVPTVIGKSAEEAKKLLEEAGFTVKTVDKESPKTKGTVLSQKPKAGSKAGTDKPVVLEVASLPLVEVPKVTGRYLKRAKSAL
ncbi:MAG: PASTA domain-containing protein, partial [Nannocystaceae bacterium]